MTARQRSEQLRQQLTARHDPKPPPAPRPEPGRRSGADRLNEEIRRKAGRTTAAPEGGSGAPAGPPPAPRARPLPGGAGTQAPPPAPTANDALRSEIKAVRRGWKYRP